MPHNVARGGPRERVGRGVSPSGFRRMFEGAFQALLNDAIPYIPPRWSRSYPQRLYAVSDGVVFRAAPTNPGTSYHGFPEHPSTFPRAGNARDVKRQILERATEQGCEREVRRWMNW